VSASASAAAAAAPAGPSQPTAMDLDAFMTDEELCRKRQEEADHALAMQLSGEINIETDRRDERESQIERDEKLARDLFAKWQRADTSRETEKQDSNQQQHAGPSRRAVHIDRDEEWEWVRLVKATDVNRYDTEEVMTRGRQILDKEGDKAVIKEQLTQLAVEMGCLTGKWLIKFAPDQIAEAFDRVCEAMRQGMLGSAAKRSLEPKDNLHVICVYTRDFRDKGDVHRVLNALRAKGLAPLVGKEQPSNYISPSKSVTYKTDLYTIVGIYMGNPWQLPPTIYQSNSGEFRKYT